MALLAIAKHLSCYLLAALAAHMLHARCSHRDALKFRSATGLTDDFRNDQVRPGPAMTPNTPATESAHHTDDIYTMHPLHKPTWCRRRRMLILSAAACWLPCTVGMDPRGNTATFLAILAGIRLVLHTICEVLAACIPLDLAKAIVVSMSCTGIVAADPQAKPEPDNVGLGRRSISSTMASAQDPCGTAASLAALFSGANPESLLNAARRRFRTVSWEVLRKYPQIIINGCSVDGAGVSSHMYALSKHSELGECDAFWSHSWYDNGLLKWEAMSAWAEAFERVYGRWPNIWLDVVCLEQASIHEDLQCLPIFLAGCKAVVITSGVSYTQRLWCSVEMYVHVTMEQHLESKGAHCGPPEAVVMILGSDDMERQRVRDAWLNFDARACQCWLPEDKTRILAVVDGRDGGVDAFNTSMRGLAMRLFRNEED